MLQLRFFASDADSDLRAFVVVDSLVGGRAMGGTRMTGTVTVDEVAGLARKMSLKLALAGIPIGGAKAGIVCDLPAGVERDRRLAAFGRAVAPLLHGGIYLGADQGVSHRDRDVFFGAARYDVCREPNVRRLPCDWTDLWKRCEDVTGYGISVGVVEASQRLGLRDHRRTAVVQGFGAVGRAAASRLDALGFRIVAVADCDGTVGHPAGLPLGALLDATDARGTIDRARLPRSVRASTGPEAWLDVPADVLVLAAGGDAVRADNVARVGAAMVVEGGNLACSAEAHAALARRGVPVLPDIVVNVGGAAVTGLVLTGRAPTDRPADELAGWLYSEVSSSISRSVSTLLDRASRDRRPLAVLATELAGDCSAAARDAGGLAAVA